MATRRIWIPKATESLSMRQTELISWNDRRLLNCNEGWRIWRHESCIIVIIIIYYYVLLLLCIIRHFSWQKLRHSLHLSRPLRCPVICAVRGSCHPPYDHMRWSCTQFSLPWNVKWLYSILHTSIFSALCTHTHGFIYIYKPDTNSNTVLPCARPKHIHITYHSFTILTHIYIYLFIFLVLRANKSSTCSLFPELVPLISQSFSEANFLVQAVKLDPLGLVTSLDTTLSLQCQSQCVSCLDMSRSSAWSDSTTASQVSALSSAHASGKSPQPKVQFGSMRINLVQNARCCWSITKGWRGMPLISTSGSLKGIKRMAARELSKIFWCPACFSHASALL